jgi:5-methylcytosine-specific restriction protein A
MTEPSLASVAIRIQEATGLALDISGQSQDLWEQLTVRLHDFPQPLGFAIVVARGPSIWRCELKVDTFPRRLFSHLRESFEENSQALTSMIERAQHDLKDFALEINSVPLSQFTNSDEWIEIQLVAANAIHFDGNPNGTTQERAEESLVQLLEYALLPFVMLLTEPLPSDSGQALVNGSVEGELSVTTCTKYERDKGNRLACLAHFGHACQVCGVTLSDVYGQIADGFIHVHHLEPLSEMAGPRAISPQLDLIPLCPNCHYVAHRRRPPYTPEELRAARFSRQAVAD